MASFVQNSKEGGGEVVFKIASSETCIVRAEARAERMCRSINSSTVEIKADVFCNFSVESLLICNGVISV